MATQGGCLKGCLLPKTQKGLKKLFPVLYCHTAGVPELGLEPRLSDSIAKMTKSNQKGQCASIGLIRSCPPHYLQKCSVVSEARL